MSGVKRSFRPRFEQLEDRLTPSDNPSLPVPVLSSLPGAKASIYLDFNGHFDASWGSFSNVDTPAFDNDGNINAYSANELQAIQDIWKEVAEDYAPFNINVTTVVPTSFALLTAVRVSIGGNGSWNNLNAGGLAFLEAFNTDLDSNGLVRTAYVFSGVFTITQNIATASSHEAGHTFGLQHQTEYINGQAQNGGYYTGLPDGTAPIMGVGYDVVRTLWWYGTSTTASTFQEDVAVISRPTNAFGYRADDAGNTNATAAALTGTSTKNPDGTITVTVAKKGIIAQMSDVDVYSFKAVPGPVSFKADVPDPFNNLDVKVELRDSSGAVLASDDPSGSFDASVSFTIPKAGTYYLAVSSHGVSSAATPTNYGNDVGGYEVDGTYVGPASQQNNSILNLFGAVRWVYQAKTKTYSAIVTLMPTEDITGPFTVTIKLPNGSIQWITPGGTRSGKNVKMTYNNDLTAGTPFRFVVKIKNPLHKDLGTFFKGLKIGV